MCYNKLKNEMKGEKMSVPIQFEKKQDICIFCGSTTEWKNVKYNRPICIECSKVHELKEVILHKYQEE